MVHRSIYKLREMRQGGDLASFTKESRWFSGSKVRVHIHSITARGNRSLESWTMLARVCHQLLLAAIVCVRHLISNDEFLLWRHWIRLHVPFYSVNTKEAVEFRACRCHKSTEREREMQIVQGGYFHELESIPLRRATRYTQDPPVSSSSAVFLLRSPNSAESRKSRLKSSCFPL